MNKGASRSTTPRRRSADQRPTAIDLFCGCGGLSVGLGAAGYDVVAALDADPLAAATYKRNHPSTHVVTKDVRKVYAGPLMKKLGLARGDLDLLAGCPPCQGFSSLRTKNGSKLVDDEMNDLVFEFTRFVRAFLPKAIMLENVPGLFSDVRLELFRSEIHALGYKSDVQVRDAADFGVPQRRRRMILIALLGEKPKFADPAAEAVTVQDAIGDLESPENSEDAAHNYSVRRADHVLELIRKIPKDGGSRNDLPKEAQLPCHQRSDGFWDIYGRMRWSQPSPTITGGCINPSKGDFSTPLKTGRSPYAKPRSSKVFRRTMSLTWVPGDIRTPSSSETPFRQDSPKCTPECSLARVRRMS